MKPKLQSDKGWTEAIIVDECEFDKLYAVADVLSNHFNLTFSNKLGDFDSLYWDFEYKSHELVLHYNIYLGVSIFPRAFKSATQADNESVVEIFYVTLSKIINSLQSDSYENGSV